MDNGDVVYTVECYSVKKTKNGIRPFVAIQMHLEMIILSEVNQKEKDKHCMILLIRGI